MATCLLCYYDFTALLQVPAATSTSAAPMFVNNQQAVCYANVTNVADLLPRYSVEMILVDFHECQKLFSVYPQ